MTRKSGAFTLVELLVAIAVIALIAAILFPVFGHAKVAAKKSSNASNLRQLGQALSLYASDVDDWLPIWSEVAYNRTNGLGGEDTEVFNPSRMWDSKLVPYVREGNAPTEDKNLNRGGVWRSPGAEESALYRSYGLNQMLVFEWLPQKDEAFDVDIYRWRHMNVNSVDQPSTTLAIGDGGREGRLSPPRNFDGWSDKFWKPLGHYRREAPWRYDGSAGYVFLDGHSKYMPGDVLYVSPATPHRVSNIFGMNHCAMAEWFLPLQTEKAWHISIAKKLYSTDCNKS